jgi:hypothetical protein
MNEPLQIVQAGPGADTVIWLIVGIIWVVAQIVNKMRASPGAPGSPAKPRPKSPDQQLQEFFERMANAQKEQGKDESLNQPLPPVPYGQTQQPARPMPPPPPRATPPPPPPARTRPANVVIRKREVAKSPPPVIPVTPKAAPAVAPISAFVPPASAMAYPAERPTPSSVAMQTTSGIERDLFPKLLLMKSSMFKVASPPLAANRRQTRPAKDVLALFGGRKALMNSLISRVVLGPPRSLE